MWKMFSFITKKWDMDDVSEWEKTSGDYYSKSTGIIGALSLFCVISLFLNGAVFYLRDSKPPPNYFIVSPNSTTERIVPVTKPILHANRVQRWVEKAISEVFYADFTNINQRLLAAEIYFNDDGFAAFMQAIEGSGIKEQIITQKNEMFFTPTSPARILNSGVYRGKRVWRVQMPGIISISGASVDLKRSVMLTIQVREVETTESPEGLAISQLISASR